MWLEGNASVMYLASIKIKTFLHGFINNDYKHMSTNLMNILFSYLLWTSSRHEKCDFDSAPPPSHIIYCTASCSSLILPHHKNKSTWTASAVKWDPEEILIKGVWHLNMFASLHAGTGAPCTVPPLACTSGEFGCAWCRPKSSLYAATLSLTRLWLKLTEVSYVCVCVLHSYSVMAVNTLRCWKTSHSSCEVLSTHRHKQKSMPVTVRKLLQTLWGENPAHVLVYFMIMSHFSENDLKMILDSFHFLSHLKPPKTPCKSHS